MSVFLAKAQIISQGLVATHKMEATQAGASPFLDLIMQLLQSLLPTLLNCLPKNATAAEVHAAMQKLTWFQMIFVNREIRQSLGTRRAYREMGDPIATEIVKMLSSTTAEETQAAMDEVNAA